MPATFWRYFCLACEAAREDEASQHARVAKFPMQFRTCCPGVSVQALPGLQRKSLATGDGVWALCARFAWAWLFLSGFKRDDGSFCGGASQRHRVGDGVGVTVWIMQRTDGGKASVTYRRLVLSMLSGAAEGKTCSFGWWIHGMMRSHSELRASTMVSSWVCRSCTFWIHSLQQLTGDLWQYVFLGSVSVIVFSPCGDGGRHDWWNWGWTWLQKVNSGRNEKTHMPWCSVLCMT